MAADQEPPAAVTGLFKKSIPNFKTQTHFYGYDGRGSDPTRFDCNYTYNLGRTVFSLIANGATGQMAAIRNLELAFEDWEPMGIPIAPLMHLEERKGKLALVLEKSVVNVDEPAFRVARRPSRTMAGGRSGAGQQPPSGAHSLYRQKHRGASHDPGTQQFGTETIGV